MQVVHGAIIPANVALGIPMIVAPLVEVILGMVIMVELPSLLVELPLQAVLVLQTLPQGVEMQEAVGQAVIVKCPIVVEVLIQGDHPVTQILKMKILLLLVLEEVVTGQAVVVIVLPPLSLRLPLSKHLNLNLLHSRHQLLNLHLPKNPNLPHSLSKNPLLPQLLLLLCREYQL